MNLFQFMSGSPVLAFLLVALVMTCAVTCWRLTVRAINIKHHGWPPAHCDADGDFKEESE